MQLPRLLLHVRRLLGVPFIPLHLDTASMAGSIKTETETVIKKVLPYLRRRGYDAEKDIDFETATKTTDRYSKGYVDLLITCGKAKPQFLIEAKRTSKKLTAADRDQALSYGRSPSIKVPFVVVTNGAEVQCFNTANGKPIRWSGKLIEKIPTRDQLPSVISALKADKDATDIALATDASLPFRPGLPLKQLNALFARCHNAIRKIEKNEENAFSDFSKLLFLKLLEEKADRSDGFELPYSYRFHELAEKSAAESDQIKDAVLKMIATIKAKTSYGDVLEDKIHLNKPQTFRYIVEQLARVSFEDSSLDTKGAAFEYFVRATLKGKKLGQYFTPRPLVELMVTLVGREKVVGAVAAGSSVKVLDPACGTGGFLVYMMKDALGILESRYSKKQITKKALDELSNRIKCHVFYGSDANDGVACAAKMNMIIAGDGHTNIRAEDSLASAAANWSLDTASCDLILTNPPFGTSESESLEGSELAAYPVPTSKGQHLFLEKMVCATLPGGEICTVIDEGVLNTAGAAGLRRWLLQKCELLAVVMLPDDTFKPNKINVKSSLLLMRRRETDDVDLENNYPITFCEVRSLGYIGSGERLRGFDFPKFILGIEESLLEHKPGERNGYGWDAFDVNAQDVIGDDTARIDFKYWQPQLRKQVQDISALGGKTVKELNKVETARGKSPPAELYVDEADGFALVVKAGSNISKFGRLVTKGDYIEKSVYDEMVEKDAESKKKEPGKRDKSEYLVQKRDILLASTGDGTLGKCCVYDDDGPAIADGHVTIIRVDPAIVDPYYLADYLRCGLGALQIQRLFTGSTGLIELTPEHVNSIVVDLRKSVPEQQHMSKTLREKESQYQASIKSAEEALKRARKQLVS